MAEVFLDTVNRSICAAWLVLAVLLLRLALKNAPRWVNVVLWGLVAVRLICPFTLQSALSMIPSTETVSPQIMLEAEPTIHTGIEAVNRAVNPVISQSFAPEPAASANPLQILIPIAALGWVTVMAVMALYALVSYLHLRRRVRTAIRIEGNVFLSECVSSPFVLGIFRPRIYLPDHMDEPDRTFVLAHERAHICRKDHLWKPIGFLLLTIHWFNPLLWLAYVLLCRDIELACDEKVIQKLGHGQRADYSEALLHCSIDHKVIAASPIAFGEVGVKERIQRVLRYRKPGFRVILTAVIACIVTAVCFLTDPVSRTDVQLADIFCQSGYLITGQEPWKFGITIYKKQLPEDIYSEAGHTFAENEVVVYKPNLSAITVDPPKDVYTSSVYLHHVGFDGPEQGSLVFTFDISYNLPESGSILLPYTVDSRTGSCHYASGLASHTVFDRASEYDNAAYLREHGPEQQFSVTIRTDVVQKASERLSMELTGFNRLSYTNGSDPAPFGKTYHVSAISYDAAPFNFSYTPATAPVYDLSRNHQLCILENTDSGNWQIAGTCFPVTLTEENFDGFFQFSDTWQDALSAGSLRRHNARAWQITVSPNLAETVQYYLLLQENGDVYLTHGYYNTETSEGMIRWVFRLDAQTAAPPETAP